METSEASILLAALGHESRLAVYRLLVEAGMDGLSAGHLGEELAMPPATLSFHLAHLTRTGLITGRRDSRFIYYAANYTVMNELLTFLTKNCCQGQACETPALPCRPVAKIPRRTTKVLK